MKKKMNKKVVFLVTAMLVISFSLGSVAFAADNFQNLRAWFGDIKIFTNNQQVQLSAKPFIVDGTTYVPLRAVSDIFNKDIYWDGVNYRIDINDKPTLPDENIFYLTQQLVERQTKITELEKKVAELEAKLEENKNTSNSSISELEKFLNKEFGTYKRVNFDIDLSQSKDKITVSIYVDLSKQSSRWNDLSSSDIKDLLQDITDEILYDFKNADVTGTIEDSSKNRNNELVYFYTNSRGNVVVEGSSTGSNTSSISQMEDYLNRNHYKHKSVEFDIQLSGNKDKIRVYLVADRYGLDYLTTSEIKAYLEKIYDEINYDFPDAIVEGSIEDSYTIHYFDFDSRGNVYLD